MLDFLNILNNKQLREFVANVEKGKRQTVLGVSTEIKGLLLSLCGKKSIFVYSDIVSAGKIATQAEALGVNCKFILNCYEDSFGLVDKFAISEYISSLYAFVTEQTGLLFVSVEALFQKAPTKKDLLNGCLRLEKGANFDFKNLTHSLIEMGYNRVEFLSGQSQFLIRGNILEIFSINQKDIVRIEFFDTEIERISLVTADEKKLVKELEQIEIIAINYKQSENNLLNLAEKVFFDEPIRLENSKNFFIQSLESLNENGNFVDEKLIFKTCAKSRTSFMSIQGKSFFESEAKIALKSFGTKKYIFDFKELVSDINFYSSNGLNIFLFCGSEENKKRLMEFLVSNNIFSSDLKLEKYNSKNSNSEEFISKIEPYDFSLSRTIGKNENQKGKIFILSALLPFSIALVNSDAILIGSYDLFKKQDKRKILDKKASIYAPKPNEYVVHNTHGIGKCIGAKKLKLTDYEKDYFIIEFAGGDKLYLPTEQADIISAYLGSENTPQLNKLGSADFERIKNRVNKTVKKLAINLLELYSKREQSKGFVYKKDDYLMEQFENAFQFEETPDQLRAISDIKSDMESPRIMDRLVCGDAGYGKTEVALRAAYKAILSGKQVAFLCPTTILAEQHFKTCQNRFGKFMVKTARLTRLVSAQENKNTLRGLESGEIDIVCGTHKLLGKNVKIKNLGLLILDEEQRFGVEDKEKIKNLKTDVDVLALSATPIPRTLHMSLTGIRDISIIETPPVQRIPVQTFVTEFSDDLLIKACRQELARKGQILILYNRIETIFQFAAKIEKLLPEIKIGVAHGRLAQKQLEDTILRLYSGEFQILIATTLIENGIDLPNANTLIVINSDMLGLAQLYQLRGRIGRSNRLAFAYFTYNSDKILTETAFQRLEAIIEYTQPGSGFKIALKDLDIRGVGNILGREQHGSMEKVGYHLYCKLLEEAIKKLKGEKVEEEKAVQLDIALNAFISEEYIEAQEDRIKKYTQISRLNSLDELDDLKTDIQKTFGQIPSELENLMLIALLKNLAIKQKIQRILITQNICKIFFYNSRENDENGEIIPVKIAEKLNDKIANLGIENQPVISFNNQNKNIRQKIFELIEFLDVN
jgi:transcription-repair coupling factor (superfamily II helicase)